MNNQKRIFIIAGEPSGDHHAADYIKEHSKINPNIHFDAFGQNEIGKTTAKIIYNTENISVIGIIEVIAKYREMKNRPSTNGRSASVGAKESSRVFEQRPRFEQIREDAKNAKKKKR